MLSLRVGRAFWLTAATLILFSFAVAESAAQSHSKKVLLIGIDGCRPDAIPTSTQAFTLHRLIKEGAFAAKCDVIGDRAKNVLTITGPGWSTALTGVWVDKHGVKDNLFRDNNLAKYPNFFRRIHERRPDAATVALVSWKPFAEEIFSQADGRRLLIDGDTKGYEEGDRVVTKAAVDVMTNENPDVVFAYFGCVDSLGHGYGFHPKSPRYTKGIEVVDEQISRILAAMQKRPNFAKEDWLIMVCTDHGGKGRDHGFDHPEMRTGFVILHGADVKKGTIDERVFNVDVAVTALAHMGIEVQPQWQLDGKVIGLKR